MDEFVAILDLMVRTFQNGVKVINVMMESEGRVNHWADTIYIVLKYANHASDSLAFVSSYIF